MNEDPLAPARGCSLGLLLGAALWILFWGGLALIVVMIARSS